MPPELLQYAVFGLLYYLQAEHCIKGVKHYLHALWFSVQTAATIGYGGDLSPDPYCSVTNALVTCQVIISLLTDYSMLGIVFTRFANPSSRTSTIRFSKQMAMTHQNGIWRLTFRVANIRKHQILRPEIRILLLRFNSKHPDADDAGYLHQELQITSGGLTPSKITWLGLPTSMSHIVDADSPLSGMMPADMEQEDMEILVLLDGIDATTSGVLQARCSYQPADIQLNEKFRPVVRRASDGMLTVNFAAFDLLSNTEPETPADLEVGQASELVALAQGPSSTYVPPAAESSWLSGNSKSQSQIRLQQLQALCAAIRMDEDISDNIRSVCAALYENLSTADQE
ncbi:TPA: hypothetical protein ACH3X3_009852 [Trebouxia sp. C0006]